MLCLCFVAAAVDHVEFLDAVSRVWSDNAPLPNLPTAEPGMESFGTVSSSLRSDNKALSQAPATLLEHMVEVLAVLNSSVASLLSQKLSFHRVYSSFDSHFTVSSRQVFLLALLEFSSIDFGFVF
jgi:hypothetical protein